MREGKADHGAPPHYDLQAAGYPRIVNYSDQLDVLQQGGTETFADMGQPARIWQEGDTDGSAMIVTVDTRNRIELERQGVCRPSMTG